MNRFARKMFRRVESVMRGLLYWKWVFNTRLARNVSLPLSEKVTVIIPAYHSRRTRNVQSLVRCLLKCDFVEKVIVSNHNPRVSIEDRIKVSDNRVELISQPVRRGCGYGWVMASRQNAEYFIVIDDDMLLHPRQLALLFQRLVERPEVPHGLVGRMSNGEYVKGRETEVETLYNVYAVTRAHVSRYLALLAEITERGYASHESVEYWADDVLISQTGTHRPRIHRAGPLLQCKTHNVSGVAIFTEASFARHREEVRRALKKIFDRGVIH